MFHVFVDIRISRRLTAHVLTDDVGQIIGQYRQVYEFLDRLRDEGVTQLEVHGPGLVYKIEIKSTAELSEESGNPLFDSPVLPWHARRLAEEYT